MGAFVRSLKACSRVGSQIPCKIVRRASEQEVLEMSGGTGMRCSRLCDRDQEYIRVRNGRRGAWMCAVDVRG